MKTNIKILVIVLLLGSAAYAAFAENVTISTFYPSPYGSYQTLETNTLQGAAGTGNMNLVPTGGNIAVGTAAVPGLSNKLDVILAAGNGVHIFTTGTGGLNLGVNGSTIQSRTNTDVNGGGLVLQPVSGNVGVGVNNPGYALDVNGTVNSSKVRLTTNTTSAANELQVDCTGGSGCYALAVYS